jgi:NAD(P)-dependent dehydrogenase (short-subunit alcohol dehydrogenase family)
MILFLQFFVGAHIVLACRNKKIAQDAADSIVLETSNTAVQVEELDLADLNSIRKFAQRMNANLERLDILINNAG